MSKPLCCSEGGCISGTEYKRKLKLSMQTHQTHINTVFEYCHASVILDNINVLYLEDLNEYRSAVKNKNRNYVFFLKKLFLVSRIFSHDSKFSYRNNERDDKRKLIQIRWNLQIYLSYQPKNDVGKGKIL